MGKYLNMPYYVWLHKNLQPRTPKLLWYHIIKQIIESQNIKILLDVFAKDTGCVIFVNHGLDSFYIEPKFVYRNIPLLSGCVIWEYDGFKIRKSFDNEPSETIIEFENINFKLIDRAHYWSNDTEKGHQMGDQAVILNRVGKYMYLGGYKYNQYHGRGVKIYGKSVMIGEWNQGRCLTLIPYYHIRYVYNLLDFEFDTYLSAFSNKY